MGGGVRDGSRDKLSGHKLSSWSCLLYSRLAQVKFSVALSNSFFFFFGGRGGGGVAIAVSVIMTRSHMNSREET